MVEETWGAGQLESELPRNGDYFRRTLGTNLILVTKASDGVHLVITGVVMEGADRRFFDWTILGHCDFDGGL